MGKKNKITQNQRRQIRAFVNEQYMILNEVIRKRPRFVPLKLWALGARIFIDTQKLSDYMRNGIAPKDRR